MEKPSFEECISSSCDDCALVKYVSEKLSTRTVDCATLQAYISGKYHGYDFRNLLYSFSCERTDELNRKIFDRLMDALDTMSKTEDTDERKTKLEKDAKEYLSLVETNLKLIEEYSNDPEKSKDIEKEIAKEIRNLKEARYNVLSTPSISEKHKKEYTSKIEKLIQKFNDIAGSLEGSGSSGSSEGSGSSGSSEGSSGSGSSGSSGNSEGSSGSGSFGSSGSSEKYSVGDRVLVNDNSYGEPISFVGVIVFIGPSTGYYLIAGEHEKCWDMNAFFSAEGLKELQKKYLFDYNKGWYAHYSNLTLIQKLN